MQDNDDGFLKCCKVCFKIPAFGVSIAAMWHVVAIKDDWLQSVPANAAIFTVQHKNFSGPVHVLIPDCSSARRLDPMLNSTQAEASFSIESEKATFLMRRPDFTDGEDDTNDEEDIHEEQRRLAATCGVELEDPTLAQQYLAMVYLSGKDTVEELKSSRTYLLWLLLLGILMESLNSLMEPFSEQPTVEDFLTFFCPWYVKLPCTLLIKCLKKLFEIQGQLAILNLFVMYHVDEEYYMAAFIPGKGFVLRYIFIFAYVALGMCHPRLFAATFTVPGMPMPGHNTLYMDLDPDSVYTMAGCIRCVLFIYVLVAGIPWWFGYSWYELDWLWQTELGDAVSKASWGLLTFETQHDALSQFKIVETEWLDFSFTEYLFGAHVFDTIGQVALSMVV